jgi:hypothetical protein
MDRKIMTIVSIVFALVFVLMLAMLFNIVSSTGNEATDTFGSTRDSIVYNEVKQFDDTEVSGATVISTINNLTENKSGTKMRYLVVNNESSSTNKCIKVYGYIGSSPVTCDTVAKGKEEIKGNTPNSEYALYKVTDKTSGDFINSSSRYKSELVKSDNDVVLGIMFTRK